MSLVSVANTCSHLQNCSKARLALTSVPSTNRLLTLLLALQRQGFLSTVTRGGPSPPPFLTATSHPAATDAEAALEAVVTQENVASRRLWVGLKYYNNKPVLSRMEMVSKPTVRRTLKLVELQHIVRGRDAAFVKGLTGIGECLFLSTDEGTLEAREAVERGTGGLALCRVS